MRCRFNSILCIIAGGLIPLISGCTHPWETLPPTTYTGKVINGPLNQVEPGATVTALRRQAVQGLQWPLVEFGNPFVEIGRTQSASDGTFCLKTHEGYAEKFFAESKNHHLVAWVDGHKNGGITTIALEPKDPYLTYRGDSCISSRDDEHIVSGTKKILFNLLSLPNTVPASIDEYRARGILSEKEYSSFLNCRLLLAGNAPQIEIEWANELIQFETLAKPIYFKPKP